MYRSSFRIFLIGTCLLWTLAYPMAQAQSGPTREGIKDAVDKVNENLDKENLKDYLEKALEVVASSAALTPTLLHIDAAFCAGWYVHINRIIEKYAGQMASGDESATAIVKKAEELRNKLALVCDEHAAAKPPPKPTGPGSTPSPPPPPTPPPTSPEEMVPRICQNQCEGFYNTYTDEKAKRESLGAELLLSSHTPEDTAALKDLYEKAKQREAQAKLDYYRCLEKCYKRAVGAGQIKEIPSEISKNANPEGSVPPPKTSTPANTPSRTSLRMEQRLPEGAIFASATVEPDTTIQVEQPGFALMATAEVVEVKRVNPGDHLDPKTTSSIHFDDGTGVLIEVLKKGAVPLVATVGLVSLLTGDHPQPLPVNNGSVTTYIGSDQPFETPALGINGQNKIPDVNHAVFLNGKGEKVGELATFNGIKPETLTNISVRTLDKTGSVLQEGKVPAGVMNGTPKVSFDKPVYKAGERGVLRIENQENYQALIQTTRFGGGSKLPQEPIRIIPLANITGLPSQVPFGTATVRFQTTNPGQARAAVVLPRTLPPKPAGGPQSSLGPAGEDVVHHSNAQFETWRMQFKQ